MSAEIIGISIFRYKLLSFAISAFYAGVAGALGQRVQTVITTVEPLPCLFASVDRKDVFDRVRDARWDVLYELSWSDLALEIRAQFPWARLIVLTPEAGRREEILETVFGLAGRFLDYKSVKSAFESRLAFQRESPFGTENIEIDRATARLLRDRYSEDLATLRASRGIDVV